MRKMFSANAVDRIDGAVTFARIVLLGPVLKNRKKSAAKITAQAAGNGVYSIRITHGAATRIAAPDTRKYEPGKRERNRSPAIPPSSVAVSPATAVSPPKTRLTCSSEPALRYS